MQTDHPGNITITHTTKSDFSNILWLFKQAITLQEKEGYTVWNRIDKARLETDIKSHLQYKIISGNDILCLFSVQYNDPLIWRDRDKNDAIYLHRIVVNPNFRGQRQFARVLQWAKERVKKRQLKYVRMDTWAENQKLITYYKSFGFTFIENYKTPDAPELPVQNRNLNVALLELEVRGW